MRSEKFYFEGKEIAEVLYQKDKGKELIPFTNLVNEYKKLRDFFEVHPPKIAVQLIYDRKEMDKHWGEKSPSWLQAMVDNENPYVIYIFSPIVFEKITKKKQEEILSTIIHEMAHTFVAEINDCCFAWADEGVCMFAEGKDANREIKREDWLWFKDNNILIGPHIKWSEQTEYQGYSVANNLVSYILDRFGKNTMIGILRIKRIDDKELKAKMGKLLGGSFERFIEDFEKTLKFV